MTLKDCSHSTFLRSRERKASVFVTSSVLCVWYVGPFRSLLTLKHFIFASKAWTRGWQTFSCEAPDSKYFSLSEPYRLCGNWIKLFCCNMKAAPDGIYTDELCYVPIKLCLPKCEVGWIWPSGHSFLTPRMVCGSGMWVVGAIALVLIGQFLPAWLNLSASPVFSVVKWDWSIEGPTSWGLFWCSVRSHK